MLNRPHVKEVYNMQQLNKANLQPEVNDQV